MRTTAPNFRPDIRGHAGRSLHPLMGSPIRPARAADVFELISEVVCILSRALSAAHTYETLRTASDQRLAKQGLRHGELPRAAYDVLIGEARTRTGPGALLAPSPGDESPV